MINDNFTNTLTVLAEQALADGSTPTEINTAIYEAAANVNREVLDTVEPAKTPQQAASDYLTALQAL